MPHDREADVIINGCKLSHAQSLTLRVAIDNMLSDLSDPEHMKALGEIGPLYKKRLKEIQDLIFLNLL